MKIFNIFWKISFLIIGIVIIFLMATSSDRRYEAFQDCNINTAADICAKLFSN